MSGMPGHPDLDDPLARSVPPELAVRSAALDAALHPDFLFAGPFGYLRDRREWIDRFVPGNPYWTEFTAFAFSVDRPARFLGDVALIMGTQQSAGTHQGEPFEGRHRASLVMVHEGGWLVAGLHLSLREPPGPA